MAELLPPEEFVKLYLERSLISEDLLTKHAITGELLPDVLITDIDLKPAEEVRVKITHRFYDASVIKELLGPTRDRLWERAKERRVFTRLAPLCRPTYIGEHVECEYVPYHYIRIIHSNPDIILRERGLYEPMRLRDALWPLVVRRNRLVPLEKSVMPNALSVHILPVTRDGYIVLTRRSPRLSIAANTLSMIEGYVEADWDLYEETADDLAFIELEDEAGLKRGEMENFYLATYRSLWTMGRPLMLFLGFYRGTGEELKRRIEAVNSWEHAGIEVVKLSSESDDIESFIENLDRNTLEEFTRSKYSELSPTLKLYTHILASLRVFIRGRKLK